MVIYSMVWEIHGVIWMIIISYHIPLRRYCPHNHWLRYISNWQGDISWLNDSWTCSYRDTVASEQLRFLIEREWIDLFVVITKVFLVAVVFNILRCVSCRVVLCTCCVVLCCVVLCTCCVHVVYVLCCVVLCCVVLCCVVYMLCCVVYMLCCVVLCCVVYVLCTCCVRVVLCCIVLCCAVLCCVVLC
jgi:hypothetical protein